MEKDLLVICPTRGRIKECGRMIKSFKEKSSNRVKLIFIIDDDDIVFDDYVKLFIKDRFTYYIQKKKSICEMYNFLITQIYSNYNYYSETNDDFVYHTGKLG